MLFECQLGVVFVLFGRCLSLLLLLFGCGLDLVCVFFVLLLL